MGRRGPADRNHSRNLPASRRGAPGPAGFPMFNSFRALALVLIVSATVLGAAMGSISAIAPIGADGAGVPMPVGP